MLEQRTFEGMGKLPVLPIAPHPEDMVFCEDMDGYKRRADCLESADGRYWDDDDELEYCNEYLVREYLEGVIEWSDEYRASEECGGEYAYLVWENPSRMRDSINEWLEDNVEEYGGLDDAMLNDIIDDLEDGVEFDCLAGPFGGSSHDVDFECFEVGEVEEQIDINDVPLLKALHDSGALEGILEELASDFCLHRCSRPIMEDRGDHRMGPSSLHQRGDYPIITLMNNTDLWYWFGCSGETLLEVYNKHMEDTI